MIHLFRVFYRKKYEKRTDRSNYVHSQGFLQK